MGGSHFIVQTSKFLLTKATAKTLGQGLGKVIQFISQTYTSCVPNIWGLAQTVLTWEAKVFAAVAAAVAATTDAEAAAETNRKHL